MAFLLFAGRQDRPVRRRLDPRTKLFMLLAGNLAVLCSPGLTYDVVMVAVILLWGLWGQVYRYTLTMAAVYLLLAAVQPLGALYLHDGLQIFLATFILFVRKIFPCAMMGGIFIATTGVSEFMAAMHKLHMPRSLIIPLTVMLRYLPMVKEEWAHIRDAMNMRGIAASWRGLLTRPLQTTEWVYVPMMIGAAKIADELAAAAVVRGIDNPKRRTCLQQLGFGPADGVWALCFSLLLMMAGER